jgi:hypothetical protein
MRLEDARHNLGWAATPIEFAGALLSANPRAVAGLKSPLSRFKAMRNQGFVEGTISGYGNGDGLIDSTLGALSGGLLGATTGGLLAVAPELRGMAAALARRRQALRPRTHPQGSQAARRDAHGYEAYDGMGHHYFSRAMIKEWLEKAPAWLHPSIKWFRDSSFNVLKRDTYREMYLDHFLNDKHFWGARMPNGLGRGWRGKDLGLDKHDDLQAAIFGAPRALKMAVGLPTLAANGAAGWYVTNELGLPHSSEAPE